MKKQGTTVTPPDLPAAEDAQLATQATAPLAKAPDIDFGADAQQYQDHFEKTALQIPFLRALQSNSHEVTPGDAKYLEHARQGNIVNTVSGEVFKAIEVIPCYHRSTFIEWVPRDEGGGFVKDHGYDVGEQLLATCKKRPESNRDVLPNGNELIATEVYAVLQVREDGSLEQALMNMTSTQLKKARGWNSKIRMKRTVIPGVEGGPVAGAAMFFNTWKITTTPEKNDKGSWHGYVVSDGRSTLDLGNATYLAAKEFRSIVEGGIQSGTVRVADVSENAPAPEDAPF